MSLFDVIGFGLLPQRCPPFSGDTPPLSFLDTSHRAGESVETLSDVVGRSESTAHSTDSTLCHNKPTGSSDDLNEAREAGRKTTFAEIFERRSASMKRAGMVAVNEEEEQTPNTYDMGVSSSHGGSEIGLVTGGLDRLDVSLYGLWSPSTFNALAPKLNAARKRAEAGTEGAYVVTDEGDRLEVAPSGVRHGVYCRWSLSWEGTQIDIVDNAAPSESRLSVFVSIGSIRLMKVGHDRAWSELMTVLGSLGYEHIRDVVSRSDSCVDLADITMSEVKDCVRGERIICRAGSYAEHGKWEDMQTYSRGKGNTMVRIYNKARECEKDPVKRAIMIAHRWGKPCADALRVEFQLRRVTLQRHFSITTVSELFLNLGTITTWCSEKWFRLTDRRVDRKNKNQQRAESSEFWLTVQVKFQEWTCPALTRQRQERGEVRPDFQALEKQAVGCIAKIAAHKSEAEFIAEGLRILKAYKQDGKDSVSEKRQLLSAQSRVVIDDAEIPF